MKRTIKKNTHMKRALIPVKERPTSVRLPAVLEEQLEQAMTLSGLSRSDLIQESIRKHTEAIIHDYVHSMSEHRMLILDEENFQRFVNAIDKPTEPNAHLINLMRG